MLIATVFRSVIDLVRHPRLFAATCVISFVFQLALAAIEWRFPTESPVEAVLTLLALVVRTWLGFGLTLMCLGVLRRQPWSWSTLAVPLLTSARAVAVELAWALPFLLAASLLIVAHLHPGPTVLIAGALAVIGIYTAIIFSQVAVLVLDGRSTLFDAFNASSQLTEGARADIFALFAGLFIALALAGTTASLVYTAARNAGVLALSLSAKIAIKTCGWTVVETAGVFVSASLYHALVSRATRAVANPVES